MSVQNNTADILRQLEIRRGVLLSAIGMAAQGHARDLCPVDTGRLRESIGWTVDGSTVYIGTNTEYAPYVEFGTGPHCTLGGGTMVIEGKNGEPRTFAGQRAQPFLKPAISDHVSEYRQYIEENL